MDVTETKRMLFSRDDAPMVLDNVCEGCKFTIPLFHLPSESVCEADDKRDLFIAGMEL
jgi:hypothetical protein